jgi:hypothetical protein
MNSSETKEKSPDMLLAEGRLDEAQKTSEDIAGKVKDLQSIKTKLNEQIGQFDQDWERRKFLEGNLVDFLAWARGQGKLPSSKKLDDRENDARVMLLALDHVSMRLFALDAAAKLSQSEELVNLARILQLRSQEENIRAGRALASIREELGGEGASVNVENGRAQELEGQADRLIERAASLRRESEEQVNRLSEMTKTKGGQ